MWKIFAKEFPVTGSKDYTQVHILILLHTRLIKFRNVWTLYTKYWQKHVHSMNRCYGYKTLTLKYVLGEGLSLPCGTDDHGSGTLMETSYL